MFVFYLAVLISIVPLRTFGLRCSMWDLQLWQVGSSSLTRGQTWGPPALGAWSLSHWPLGKSQSGWSYLKLVSTDSQRVLIYVPLGRKQGFPSSSVGKESACNAGDLGLFPGSGRSPGEGNGNPLQYSCLENSMDRGLGVLQSMGSQRVGHYATNFPFLSFPFPGRKHLKPRCGSLSSALAVSMYL